MSWASKLSNKMSRYTGFKPLDPLGSPIVEQFTGMAQAREANEASLASTREQMAFQNEQAKIQREWESGMSNTAHQREVEDLKKAGLNPVLSAGGGGASTPSATVPSGSSYQAQNELPGGYLGQISKVLDLVNTATSIQKESATAKNLNTQTKLLEQKMPKGAVMANLWDVLLPESGRFGYSAKKFMQSSDLGTTMNAMGVKPDSKIGKSLKAKNYYYDKKSKLWIGKEIK